MSFAKNPNNVLPAPRAESLLPEKTNHFIRDFDIKTQSTSSSMYTVMDLEHPKIFVRKDGCSDRLPNYQLQRAFETLYERLDTAPIMRHVLGDSFERRELLSKDPPIKGQVYALFSWQPHPDAKPSTQGNFGTFKIRGVAKDSYTATQLATDLIENVDSSNVIRQVFVGETFPLLGRGKKYVKESINTTYLDALKSIQKEREDYARSEKKNKQDIAEATQNFGDAAYKHMARDGYTGGEMIRYIQSRVEHYVNLHQIEKLKQSQNAVQVDEKLTGEEIKEAYESLEKDIQIRRENIKAALKDIAEREAAHPKMRENIVETMEEDYARRGKKYTEGGVRDMLNFFRDN